MTKYSPSPLVMWKNRRSRIRARGGAAASLRNFGEAFDFRSNDAVLTSEGQGWSTSDLFQLRDPNVGGTTIVSVSFWLWQAGSGTTASPAGRNNYWGIGVPTTGADSREVALWFAPRQSNGTQTGAGWGTSDGNGFYHAVPSTPDTQEWHHHLWVWDGSQVSSSDRIAGYVDGVSVAFSVLFGPIPTTYLPESTHPLVMAGDGNEQNTQNGALKEFAVYTGTALGAADATAFYNGGAGVDHLTDSNSGDLTAYWHLNSNDSGALVTDRTGNGYNLVAGSGDTPVFGAV